MWRTKIARGGSFFELILHVKLCRLVARDKSSNSTLIVLSVEPPRLYPTIVNCKLRTSNFFFSRDIERPL